MPFDKEYDDDVEKKSSKLNVKNVSSQKSIFDSIPKKPNQNDLEKKVKQIQDQETSYKIRAADLALKYNKLLADKTLPSNKSIFQNEIESEILNGMVQFAIDLNNDKLEPLEGMGSMSWITLLLKTCLVQRDKINQLDFNISQLQQEISNLKSIDKDKKSE